MKQSANAIFLKRLGLLPPLDAPHHMRRDDRSKYREGIVTDRSAPPGTSFVDVGLPIDVTVPHQLRPGVRVTAKLQYESGQAIPQQAATAVSPSEPCEKYGLYWGYRTRLARSLGEVMSGCPFTDTSGSDGSAKSSSGYDYMIGHTSSRDTSIAGVDASGLTASHPEDDPTFLSAIRASQHILLVFGGVDGLEACVDADEGITTSAKDTDTLFDLYWNCMGSHFGSRTLRAEEALQISLTRLAPRIKTAHGTTDVTPS